MAETLKTIDKIIVKTDERNNETIYLICLEDGKMLASARGLTKTELDDTLNLFKSLIYLRDYDPNITEMVADQYYIEGLTDNESGDYFLSFFLYKENGDKVYPDQLLNSGDKLYIHESSELIYIWDYYDNRLKLLSDMFAELRVSGGSGGELTDEQWDMIKQLISNLINQKLKDYVLLKDFNDYKVTVSSTYATKTSVSTLITNLSNNLVEYVDEKIKGIKVTGNTSVNLDGYAKEDWVKKNFVTTSNFNALSNNVTKNTKDIQTLSENLSKITFNLSTENVSLIFNPSTENSDALTMSETIGGFNEGTTLKDIKDKNLTLSDMFVELLFPTTAPTIETPYATVKSGLTAKYYYGDTFDEYPYFSNAFVSHNGSITPLNGSTIWSTFDYFNGTYDKITYSNGISAWKKTDDNKYTIYGAFTYSDGGTIYDNKGNECGTLPNGTANKSYSVDYITPTFWYCYTSSTSSLSWTYTDEPTITIYSENADKYTSYELLFACLSGLTPKFYIYNDLKQSWEEEEDGLWVKQSDIKYYKINSAKKPSFVTTPTTITFDVWNRVTGDIKNTLSYQIKVIFQ